MARRYWGAGVRTGLSVEATWASTATDPARMGGSGGGLAWVTPSPIGCCQGIPHRDGPR